MIDVETLALMVFVTVAVALSLSPVVALAALLWRVATSRAGFIALIAFVGLCVIVTSVWSPSWLVEGRGVPR